MSQYYKLTNDVRQLMDAIGEGGELTPETEAILDSLTKDQNNFIKTLGEAIRECNMSSTACRSEAAWFTHSARRHETTMDNLKDYLKSYLESQGISRFTTDTQDITVCNSPAKVEVDSTFDIEAIDDIFVKVEKTLKSDVVKEVYKTGGQLPQGVNITKGKHLKITPR